MLELSRLTTETRNEATRNLDTMKPLEIATLMNREDEKVVAGIREVLPEIEKAIILVRETFEAGGRLIYMGAGTSGRLGVLDSVECPPTFGVSPDMVVGLIAGGEGAFIRAVEGAEDSEELGVEELKGIGLSDRDIVIGIAASGRTPYVIGGLGYARSLGCKTIAIACNKGSLVGEAADLAVEPVAGPEVLTGSTRLKAGTAQKMVLNMISTGAMVGIGKVYENLMVDVQPTNEKLWVRAGSIVTEATGCSSEQANLQLEAAGGSVKIAIIMELLGCSASEAEEKLKESRGHIRKCL